MVRHTDRREARRETLYASEIKEGCIEREREVFLTLFLIHALFHVPSLSPSPSTAQPTPPSLESLSIHALTPPPSPKLEISPRTSKWIYYRERKWIFAFILTSPSVSITAFNHTLFIELTL